MAAFTLLAERKRSRRRRNSTSSTSEKKGRIRFLPEGGHEGLSAAQLAAVRYNGDRHVKLDGEGWLHSYVPGMTISFR